MSVRLLVIVMGVSGCGKSTIGQALAHDWQLPFLEADELHGAHNVAKMHAGEPLTDEDREPWLRAIGAALQDVARYPRGLVVACSALRRRYRDTLRSAAAPVQFLFLDISESVATERVRARHHHFMPPSLVPSQFATLERPDATERDALTVSAEGPVDTVLSAARAALHQVCSATVLHGTKLM
jgi:gluconokinase